MFLIFFIVQFPFAKSFIYLAKHFYISCIDTVTNKNETNVNSLTIRKTKNANGNTNLSKARKGNISPRSYVKISSKNVNKH